MIYCSSPPILKNYPEARLAFCLRGIDSNFVVTLLRLRRLRRKCELHALKQFAAKIAAFSLISETFISAQENA